MDFALDTESDRFGDRSTANTRHVLLTVCPPSATSLADVKTFFDDENAWFPFLDFFQDSDEDFNIQWFNGGYEMGALWDALIEKKYRFLSKSSLIPGTKKKQIERELRRSPRTAFLSIDKNAGFLEAIITSDIHVYVGHNREKKEGCHIMRIKDASKIAGGKDSMSKNANAIRKVHPDWWLPEMETKDELGNDDYNNGWYFERDLYPKRYDRFMHYSIQDAFSQAMIFRHLKETGQDRGISRSGNSWGMAIDLCGKGQNLHFKKMNFRKRYPPLDIDSQLLYEDGLLGGYVFGKVGEFHGVATKGDYKSSYPAGYWNLKLPSGKEHIIYPSDDCFDWIMRMDDICRFILCRFDFVLKSDIHQPCINAYECEDDDGERYFRSLNKKMREGHRRWMLTPEPYLNAIKRHYFITNFEIQEVRYFNDDGDDHFYRPAIVKFFIEKERNKKGTIFNLEAKLNMNGGMHGKNLQKIVRQYRDYDCWGRDRERLWGHDLEPSQSQYPFQVGIWVMMCRRAELLNDIADANDKGIENLMADTDSMILACDEKTFREIYGEKVLDEDLERLLPKIDWNNTTYGEKKKFIDMTLGKISVEMSDIRLFKCWGLKRYLCVNGKGKTGTAFAGMGKRGWFRGIYHDGDLQEAVLKTTGIDDELVWEQNSMSAIPGKEHSKTIERTLKHATKEEIWMTEEMLEEFQRIKFYCEATHNESYMMSKLYQQHLDEMIFAGADSDFIMEDVDAELRDKEYTEKDKYIFRKQNVKRIAAYQKEKWQDEKDAISEGR